MDGGANASRQNDLFVNQSSIGCKASLLFYRLKFFTDAMQAKFLGLYNYGFFKLFAI